jgi:hypothetical protein
VKGLANNKVIGRGRPREHPKDTHVTSGEAIRVTFDDVISGQKSPLGRILRVRNKAREPVAHVHAITSVTSFPVAPPSSTSRNVALSVLIYYLYYTRTDNQCCV